MSIAVKTDTGWQVLGVGSGTPGELPGVGGWATITGITGTAGTRYQYGDWVAYEWTADGELTTQAGGLVDALIVGGGSGNEKHPSFQSNGLGGDIISGIRLLSSNPQTVTVGAGGPSGGRAGYSALGAMKTSIAGCGFRQDPDVPADLWPGTTSDITGPSVVYAADGQLSITANTGNGGGTYSSAAQSGSSGVVICRVPKAHAYLGALPAGWVDA